VDFFLEMQPEDFFFRHRTENIFFGGAILYSIETMFYFYSQGIPLWFISICQMLTHVIRIELYFYLTVLYYKRIYRRRGVGII
jgi:hypothetical protein